MTTFVLHPEAYADLDEIWEYIADDNLDAADRVLEEIFQTIRSLVAFPHQGHKRPDLTSRPLLFHVLRDYVIAYAPDRKTTRRDGRAARSAQPSRDRRHNQGERVNLARKRKRPRSFLNVAFI